MPARLLARGRRRRARGGSAWDARRTHRAQLNPGRRLSNAKALHPGIANPEVLLILLSAQ